jgi:hypothetical protein
MSLPLLWHITVESIEGDEQGNYHTKRNNVKTKLQFLRFFYFYLISLLANQAHHQDIQALAEAQEA